MIKIIKLSAVSITISADESFGRWSKDATAACCLAWFIRCVTNSGEAACCLAWLLDALPTAAKDALPTAAKFKILQGVALTQPFEPLYFGH
jgi:hypothetical protein